MLNWEEKLHDDVRNIKAPTYPDQRLQSAVKNHIGQMAFQYHTGQRSRDNVPNWITLTVDKIRKEHFGFCQNLSSGTWIDVHKKILDGDEFRFNEDKRSILETIIVEATKITDTFRKYIGNFPLNLNKNEIWGSIYESYSKRLYCHRLQRIMVKNSRSRSNSLSVVKSGMCVFILSRELCLVYIPAESRSFYLDYDSILLLYDLWIQRNLVLISAFLLRKALPSIYTCDDTYWLSIFDWGDDLLRRYDNESFRYIKMFEAICIGELLTRRDFHQLSEPFVDSTRINFTNRDIPYLEQHLQKLLKVLKGASVEMLSETFGLYRLWGHPTINERAGCVKIKEIGKRISSPSPYILKMINACLTREFCLNYISKEGRWPNLLITDETNPLFKIHEMKKLKWNGMYDSEQLEWWSKVILRKNFEFDTCVDYSQLIDDKAISCYKEHWDYVYDKNILGYNPPRPPESRRVVMEVIRREEIDVDKILRIIQSRQIPDNWKVIGLHSKEREIKIEPRMFIMMVLEMRLYFCVTEMNIASQIFRYFPQQTMTSDETSLTNRLLSLTGRRRTISKNCAQVVINIDFEKWNLQWRINSTKYVFSLLDTLFGRPNLYTYSHEFFKESMFYLVSRFNPPDNITRMNRVNPPESDMLWYDDESGKEGIRQKGWTLITIGALLYIESLTGVTGIITGQGDNQVIVASFPMDEINKYDITLKSRVAGYVKVLIEVFEKIGLPIKAEESWCSTSLFAYGKDLIHEGAYLPIVIKKLARVMPDTNDLLPTLTNSLSTIFSSGYAACCKGYEVSIPYCVALIESYLYLLSYCKYSIVHNGRGFSRKIETLIYNDIQYAKFLLTIPHSLSGYSTMSMIDYMSRGHSDPVTAGIVAVKILSSDDDTYKQFLYYLIHCPLFSSAQDYSFLIMDPTCVNWKKPIPCTYILKRYVEEQLSSSCNNTDFKHLFHNKSLEEDKNFVEILMKIRPIAPRVLNEIYRHSPSGARSGILATISSVRTVKAIAQRTNEQSIFVKVQQFEEDFGEHMLNLYLTVKRLPLQDEYFCSTSLADSLRVNSWFPNTDIERIEGVTMPHPLEQFKLERYHEIKCKEPCIYYITDNLDFKTLNCTCGGIRPYIGSLTRERKISRLLNLPIKDPPLKSALRLQTLSDYITSPSDNLYQLLDQIIATRTSLPLGLLRFASDRILTGSRTHRLQDVGTKHGGLINIRPNANSHIYISSDKIGKVDFTSDNLNINFQVTLLTHLYLIPYMCEGSKESRTFIARLHCKQCTQSINEPLMTLSEPVSIKYNDYSTCKFLYSDGSIIPVEILTSTNGTVMPIDVSSLPTYEIKWTACYQLALQVIIVTAKDEKTSNRISQLPDRSAPNLLGIGEIVQLGFINLVLSLAHLQLLYYMLSYYNIRLPRSGITLDTLVELSIESTRYEIYQPLCEAYPIYSIRKSVLNKVDIVEPYDYSENAMSNLGIIKQIVRRCLLDHLKSVETLPPIQCYTRQEWCTVICLNLLHRLLRHELIVNPGLSVLTGVLCLKYRKVLHDTLSFSDGDELTNLLLDIGNDINNLPTYLTEDFPIQMITLDDLNHRPILRASQSVEYTIHVINEREVEGHQSPLKSNLNRPVINQQSRGNTQSCQISSLYELADDSVVGEISLPVHCPTILHDVDLRFVDLKRRFSRKNSFFTPDGSTAAHYKYASIISYLDLHPRRCMALADGAGTVTRMLVKVYNAEVFYNSLLDLSGYIQHRYVHYTPVEFDDEVIDHLIRYDLTLFHYNDLSDLRTVNSIVNELDSEQKFDLITCDLESSDYTLPLVHSVSLNVCRLARSLITQDGVVIFKVYLESMDRAYRSIQNLRVHFKNVWILISKYSNYDTSEVFVVCTQLSQFKQEMFQGDYPVLRDGVDPQVVIKLITDFLHIRMSTHDPYWITMPEKWVQWTKTLRSIEARDVSARSLLILTGSEPMCQEDLDQWLSKRIDCLQLGISLTLEGLMEEEQSGIRVSAITHLTTRNDETTISLKRQILYCLHCMLIRKVLIILTFSRDIILIYNTVDEFKSATHCIYNDRNDVIFKYNICKDFVQWERRYGLHMYKYLGHLYLTHN